MERGLCSMCKYWKVLFVKNLENLDVLENRKRSEMNFNFIRFHFHCDNYEVPWILFDAIVLSVRVMMVLALIFIILGIG